MSPKRTGHILFALLIIAAALLVGGTAFFYTCGFRGCPDVAGLRGYVPEEASVVLDRRGNEVGKLYRVNRSIVPLDSLPKYVPAAFVAIEDKRFWQHHGVDWQRVPGAVLADLKSGGYAQGFSTITMQLARNLFPNRLPAQEKSVVRKVAEMRVAMKIEDKFSKRQILQMYMNQIYFGQGAWGIEAASEEYFGKPASELTLPEAALLAGLPQSPSKINPRNDRDAARDRRDLVLTDMAEQGWISEEAADKAKKTKIRLHHSEAESGEQKAPYFIEAVRQVVEEQLGDAVYTDGLRIHTTLDLPTQEVAQEELRRQLNAIDHGTYGRLRGPTRAAAEDDDEPDYLQGAVVILDANTGDALAWVGGRDFADSKFDRVSMAKRQPGSAFKPFVYAAALSAGYPPTYALSDTPLSLVVNGKEWSPQNYEGDYRGTMSMREALVESRNVPTVRLAEQVGMDRVADMAHQMGIDEPLPQVPSLALGVASVSPLEMADAYAGFATLGSSPRPRLVTAVEDRNGNVIWAQPVESQQVVDPAVAFVLTTMLEDVVDRGTGTAVRAVGYHGPAAGKTGTTNDGKNAWFVGYTPRLVGAVWIGFDQPRTIVRGGTGGELAAPVWGRIMERVASPTGDWSPPPGVEERQVDATGNLLAEGCPSAGGVREEWFISGTAPSATCGYDGYGNYAAYGYPGYDTLGMGMDTLAGGMPADTEEGWWDRLRSRIFGDEQRQPPRPPARPQPYPTPLPADIDTATVQPGVEPAPMDTMMPVPPGSPQPRPRQQPTPQRPTTPDTVFPHLPRPVPVPVRPPDSIRLPARPGQTRPPRADTTKPPRPDTTRPATAPILPPPAPPPPDTSAVPR